MLDGDHLWYYEMSWRGKVPLGNGLSVCASAASPSLSIEEANFGGFKSKSNFAYRINLTWGNRVTRVACDTEEDQAYWISSLTRAIKTLSTGTTTVTEERSTDDLRPVRSGSVTAAIAQVSAAFAQEAPTGMVTLVFTDVQNSTKLWESNPDAMNEGLEKHDAMLRELLKLFRGYEVKTEGDAFFVAFFTVLEAILWCCAVQRALLKAEWPEALLKLPAASTEWAKDDAEHANPPIFSGIRIRMGIHCGNAKCRRNPITGRMDYFGSVVNRCARISDSGHGGQIVCSDKVLQFLKEAQTSGTFTDNVEVYDLGPQMYKGVGNAIQVYEILPAELNARHPFPPLRLHKGDKEEEEEEEGKASGDASNSTEAKDIASDEENESDMDEDHLLMSALTPFTPIEEMRRDSGSGFGDADRSETVSSSGHDSQINTRSNSIESAQ